MGFTIADLIVVLIVIGILAVYRRLDSNNRSLDKVKRFIDRVQGEMDEIVAEKITMLKDIGIEVDVHQKAAKEVLKRVQAVENELGSRADSLTEIGSRLSTYEGALNELVQMTQRAEENIARVRDESEYVDKVGKRIKATQVRIEELERSLPGIVSGFEKQNNERLGEVEERFFREGEERVSGLMTRVDAAGMRVQDFSEEVARLQMILDEQFQQSRKGLKEIYEELSEGFQGNLSELALNGRSELEMIRDDIRGTVADVEERFERFRSDSIDHLEKLGTSLETVVSDASTRLDELAASGRTLETDAFMQLKSYIEENGGALRSEMDDRIEGLQQELGSRIEMFRTRVDGDLEQADGRLQQYETLGQETDERLSALSGRLATGVETIGGRIDAMVEDLSKRIDGTAQETEQRVLSTVEARLEDYEKEIGYRYARIEQVNSDIDDLEKNLRISMDRIAERIRTDFLAFGEELRGLREQDQEEAQQRISTLRGSMDELEGGLNELKQRAYDNVSEKLKVFEDEFFTDLRERSAAMEAQITAWRTEVDGRLVAVAQEGEAGRTALEETYTQDLSSRMHQFQESFATQLARVEEQFDAFRRELQERIDSNEEGIGEFEKGMQEELVSLKERAFQSFRQEFSEADERLRTEVKSFEEEVETRMEMVREDITGGKTELEQMLSASRSDINLWRTELLNQLKSSNADITSQLADSKVQLSENLQQLKQEYSAERQELVEQSQEQRRRLWSDVDSLSKQVADLQEQLQSRTRQVLEEFGERFQRLKNDADAHEREIGDELSAQSQSFRTLISDSREQFQAMREKLFAKLDEDTTTLSVTLSEIDKRQKAFVDQTGLFERADSLKIKLTEDIEELKTELARVDALRGEIHEIEGQFSRIRKVSAEATEKMSRFSADKRRIDLLENDYRRLITLAQTVEGKIEQVGETDSQLEEITARLKSLGDLQMEVDARFDRLEKRRMLIDKTSDDIEVNGRAVSEMERRINELTTRIQSMPETIGDLTARLQEIAAARAETDGAVEQLANLDSTMKEIEERMKNLHTAREWLARTETRLEQIRKDAGDQVKLLGSIMREEAKKEPGQRGAPSLSSRETVTKLAGQGWKVEEIARATKVSRGEVELILELSGLKR